MERGSTLKQFEKSQKKSRQKHFQRKTKNNVPMNKNINFSDIRIRVALISLAAAFLLVSMFFLASILRNAGDKKSGQDTPSFPPPVSEEDETNRPMTAEEIEQISKAMTDGEKNTMTAEEIGQISKIMTDGEKKPMSEKEIEELKKIMTGEKSSSASGAAKE